MSNKLSDFDYILPVDRIAFTPTPKREDSRLLVVENNHLSDKYFHDILSYIKPNDLLVFNNSKVIKARLFGNKISGGKIEILVERIINSQTIIAHVKSNKTIDLGLQLIFPNDLHATVTKKLNGLFELHLSETINILDYLDEFGEIPLPPYINRKTDTYDDERYQTVYAKTEGSVAAPTAGLHFTSQLLDKIKAIGADIAYVTLHVGSGTFKPVTCENIHEHKMHSEIYTVSNETVNLIHKCKKNHGQIIAVGTTSLRTLETIANNDFSTLSGETDIFITPGYKFKLIDKLITNFHLPKSTLLMLVYAFAGIENIKKAYTHAIAHNYRFFSYGDAMLLENRDGRK